MLVISPEASLLIETSSLETIFPVIFSLSVKFSDFAITPFTAIGPFGLPPPFPAAPFSLPGEGAVTLL
ncbi:hypothetical protein D3C86_1770410 [compost metagenome]